MIEPLVPAAVECELLIPNNINRVARVDYRGLSSSKVFKCYGPGVEACLKYWPDARQTERLQFVHYWMQKLTSSGIEFTPKVLNANGQDSVFCHNGCWELISWKPGEANYQLEPSAAKLRSAIEAIAQIHDVCSKQQSLGPSPTVKQRLQRLDQAELLCSLHSSHELLHQDVFATRTVNSIRKFTPVLRQSLVTLLKTQTAIHFCLRDLRAEHMLFTQDRVTGVIDFGAGKLDDPMTDLVRLLGTLEPFDEVKRKESLEYYAQLRGIPSLDYNRFKTMDFAASLLSAFQWYEWLHVNQLNFEQPRQELVSRWSEFLNRVDDLGF